MKAGVDTGNLIPGLRLVPVRKGAGSLPLCRDCESDATVRVAVFEPTQLSCELMSRALEASSYGIKVVSMSVSSQFSAEAQLNHAHVAVINATLKEGALSGFTLLRRLRKTCPMVRCVMLLDGDERVVVIESFRSGAVGVCEREHSYELLCKCITCVHRGQVWANSQQMRYLLEALSSGTASRIADRQRGLLLTQREQEIVCRVAEGLKNREIAEALNVNEHTVKYHLFRIFERLGISSRAELIVYLIAGQKLGVGEPGTSRSDFSAGPRVE